VKADEFHIKSLKILDKLKEMGVQLVERIVD